MAVFYYFLTENVAGQGILGLCSCFQTLNVSYDIPAPANETDMTGSSCGASSTADETLEIAFFQGATAEWKLTLTFKYNASQKNWAATDVKLDFSTDENRFPGIPTSQKCK